MSQRRDSKSGNWNLEPSRDPEFWIWNRKSQTRAVGQDSEGLRFKKSNLVELNSRIKKIDLIKNVYVQEFNKDYMNLRIKYLGKLDKIINQLEKAKINLQLINDQWVIKTL